MTVTVVKMSFNFCFGDVGMFAIENTTFFKLDAGCPESPKTVWHCFPCSQDLKCSVISLICLHFQIKPVWCADWDACDVLFSMKTQLLDIIDKLRICINDLYIYICLHIHTYRSPGSQCENRRNLCNRCWLQKKHYQRVAASHFGIWMPCSQC